MGFARYSLVPAWLLISAMVAVGVGVVITEASCTFWNRVP
jgi:hypothetical protein